MRPPSNGGLPTQVAPEQAPKPGELVLVPRADGAWSHLGIASDEIGPDGKPTIIHEEPGLDDLGHPLTLHVCRGCGHCVTGLAFAAHCIKRNNLRCLAGGRCRAYYRKLDRPKAIQRAIVMATTPGPESPSTP